MKIPKMSGEPTLITGASSGIGLELAREFARNQHSLVIVAPVADEIQRVAEEIRQEFRIPVTPIAADLTDPESAHQIFETVEKAGLQIDVLINNAGIGQRGKFWEIPIEKDLEMIWLNVEAVLRLTKLFLPGMIQRGRGVVMNTASIAGFQPGPTLAVYHATKAFVLSFSEALATELEKTGVTVTALCPGPVDTDFFEKADMTDTAVFQKGNMMSAQEVAKIAHAAAVQGERVVIPGGLNKATVFAGRFTGESTQAKLNEKQYQEVPPEERTREPGQTTPEAASAPDSARKLRTASA